MIGGVRILTQQMVIWDLFQPTARQLYLFFQVVVWSTKVGTSQKTYLANTSTTIRKTRERVIWELECLGVAWAWIVLAGSSIKLQLEKKAQSSGHRLQCRIVLAGLNMIWCKYSKPQLIPTKVILKKNMSYCWLTFF